jgi:hypothetical protein
VLKRLADGETLKSLAKSYGVTHPTIIRALRKFEAPILTPRWPSRSRPFFRRAQT